MLELRYVLIILNTLDSALLTIKLPCHTLIVFYAFLSTLQHLLEYNDRPNLRREDRETMIEDLVIFYLYCPTI